MEEYFKNYNKYKYNFVYEFTLGSGGIGDYIKVFIRFLNFCIQNKFRIYIFRNNLVIHKYLELKYKFLYLPDNKHYDKIYNYDVNKDMNLIENKYYFYKPTHIAKFFFKDITNFPYKIIPSDIFEFNKTVIENVSNLIKIPIKNYYIIHLRLGDSSISHTYQQNNIIHKKDVRYYNENKIFNYIEKNKDKQLIFMCDNYEYKNMIKNKFPNIIISTGSICHTSYICPERNVLDTITEFYIMTQADKILACSRSGFNRMASKFYNKELVKLR